MEIKNCCIKYAFLYLAGPFFFLFAVTKAEGLLLLDPALPVATAVDELLSSALRPPSLYLMKSVAKLVTCENNK